MNKRTQAVSLTILGKEYKIACDPDEIDNVMDAAKNLDDKMRKMRDTGKIHGSESIAVIAALNLARELQLVKTENAKLTQNLNECLSNMRVKIENVLETD